MYGGIKKIVRLGMLTENEYVAARNKLMDKYLVINDFDHQQRSETICSNFIFRTFVNK